MTSEMSPRRRSSPPNYHQKRAETLVSPPSDSQLPTVSSRFRRPAGSIPPFAAASASEIINAQQRYLGSQEPRRVRGSTVPNAPISAGPRLTRLLRDHSSTQLFARQRWQASASASRRLSPNLPPVYARRVHAEAQQERPCWRVQGSFQARQRRIAAADRLTPS